MAKKEPTRHSVIKTSQVNPSPVGEAGSRARAPQKISSRALLAEADELVIVHNGREYHLRVTSNGKLILTA